MPSHLSIIPVRAVFDGDLGAAALRTLCALGSYTDKEGWCQVKQGTIAREFGVSRQAVQRQVAQLVEVGYVEERRTGRSSKYRVMLDLPMQRQVASDATPGVASDATPEVASIGTTLSNVTSQREARALATARFDAHFWPTYPERRGKKLERGKALVQWLKLSIDDQRAAVKGARNLARSEELPPNAWRWLRDRRFEDWQTPAAATSGPGTAPLTKVQRGMAAIDRVLGDGDQQPQLNGSAIVVDSTEKEDEAC